MVKPKFQREQWTGIENNRGPSSRYYAVGFLLVGRNEEKHRNVYAVEINTVDELWARIQQAGIDIQTQGVF